MRIVTPLPLQFSSSPPMLHQNARILNRHQPRRPRLFRRLFGLTSLLHPNHFRADSNRALHHRRHFLRAPKHVHDLYLLRHIFQPRITLLPQHFPLVRVHRNHPISRTLHVFRHAKTRPHRIRRQSDHRDSLLFFHEFENPVIAGLGATRHQYSHRPPPPPFPPPFTITLAM